MNWEEILAQALTTGLTIGLLMWLIHEARGRAKRVETTDEHVLIYSGWWKALFVAGTVLSLATLVIVHALQPPDEDGRLATMVFGGLAILSLVGAAEMFGTRLALSTHGLHFHSAWAGERRIAWHQIESITYSPTLMWFVVTANDGTRIRVHHMLRGIPTFGLHVREHLDEAIYRSAARFFDVSISGL